MADSNAKILQDAAIRNADSYAKTLGSFISRLENYSLATGNTSLVLTKPDSSVISGKLTNLLSTAKLEPPVTQQMPEVPTIEIPDTAIPRATFAIPSFEAVPAPKLAYPKLGAFAPVPTERAVDRASILNTTPIAAQTNRPKVADVVHATPTAAQWNAEFTASRDLKTPLPTSVALKDVAFSAERTNVAVPDPLTIAAPAALTPAVMPGLTTPAVPTAGASEDLTKYAPAGRSTGLPTVPLPSSYDRVASSPAAAQLPSVHHSAALPNVEDILPDTVRQLAMPPIELLPVARGTGISVTRPTLTTPSMRAVDRPNVTMPTAPDVGGVSLPAISDMPSIVLDAKVPTFDVLAPTQLFEYSEREYESVLNDEVRSQLLENLINGGYGINVSDEDALWARARERELRGVTAATKEITRQMAVRGFSLPPGVMLAQIQSATQDGAEKISTASREIALKRADMYVESRKFTFTQAKEMEQLAVTLHMSIAERALNASKYVAEFGISMFNAGVAGFNTALEGFKASIAEYDAKVRHAASQLETQKLKLQATSISLDERKTRVQAFVAEVEAAKTAIETYRIDVDAARSIAEAETAVNKGMIDVFTAELGANKLIADTYRTDVDAQKALADIQLGEQRANVDAYNAEVGAKRAAVDNFQARVAAARARADVDAGLARASIDEFNAWVNANRADTDRFLATDTHARNVADVALRTEATRTERFRAELDATKTDIDLFQANVAAERAQSEIESAAARTSIDAYTAQLSGSRLLLDKFQAEVNANRTLAETHIAEQKLSIDAFNSKLELSKTQLRQNEVTLAAEQMRTGVLNEANKATLQAFIAQIDARKAELNEAMVSAEIEKARIDAAVKVNEQDTRRWLADFEGMRLDAELFKTDVGYVSSALEKERIRIELFRADIAEFEAALKQNTLQLQYYDANMKGDSTNATMYLAAVEQQRKLIDFARTQADINQSNNQLLSENLRLGIAAAAGKVELYRAKVAGIASANEAATHSFAAQTDAVRNISGIYENMSKIDLGLLDMTSRQNIEKAKLDVDLSKMVWDVRLKSTTSGADAIGKAMQASLNQVIGITTASNE